MIIDPQSFISDIPRLNPLSKDYVTYWREQNKRILEGHWIDGYWMPPKLYFYANHGTIKLNKPGVNVKSYGRPTLRDIEWDFFYNWAYARGFSGFEGDEVYSCNRKLLDVDLHSREYLEQKHPTIFNPFGEFKTYIPGPEYLRKQHIGNLGTPLYDNSAYNLMMLGARNFGKSYMVGVGVILHDWLTDGTFNYNQFKAEDSSTEVMVGAWESKYTNLLLEKTKDALERLPGETSIGGVTYPAPFSRKYKGSWGPGSEVVYTYQKKEGGKWKPKGTKSNIKNRTFADNPYAGIGSRPTVFVLEEVGLCRNTKQIHAAMKDAQRDSYRKFASSMYLGTGGDMDAGALEAQEVFYNPDAYEMLPFNDTFENKGKISYFVPAYLARGEFKNPDGFTRIAEAKDFIMSMRDRLKTGSSDNLNREIINNPMVPSEMFLTKSSNVFPVAEVRRRLSVVEHEHIYEKLAKKVELYFDPNSEYQGVNYALDVRNRLTAIDKFPWTADDRDGCVVIFELPHLVDGKVPEGAYIIGHDPYKDDTNTGESLAAIYVIKTSKHFDSVGHDEIVANYIGRPYMGREIVNENLLKLSLFYGNAKIYFENAVGNVKDYFERVKRIDLLARKPHTVFNKKASFESSPIMEYGYPMSNDRIKYEALQYLRAWLLEVREATDERVIRNIDTIVDRAFLQELLTFNMDANFDRVMAMCGAIIGLNEIGNVNKEQFITGTREVNALTNEFISFIKQNKRLFQNDTFPTTAPHLQGEGQRQFFVG